MKVVFKGVIEETQRGCHVCHGRTSHLQMTTHKAYYLPSGRHTTFRIGIPVDVSDIDGEYLLTEEYKAADGKKKKVFEVWRA